MGKLGKLFVFAAWLPTTTVTLVVLLLLLHSYSQSSRFNALLSVQAEKMLPKNEFHFYAALPQVLGSFTTAITQKDARPEILRQFLHKHNSPIEPFAGTIVAASDAHSVDFRLITAISMCESNLGKRIPEGSYNAYGYAVYTGQLSGASFKDWEDGITTMATYLSERFYSRGLTTPEQIGPIYAPPSVNTGNSWANCVQQFMDELK